MRTPAPTSPSQAVPTLVLVSLAFALLSCSRSTSVPCSAERACPEGWACSADGQTCIQTLCGDNVIQSGEACDDGNTDTGDGCNSTCSSNETCGNGYLDIEREEQCDDNNQSDDDNCLATCKIARCGDKVLSPQSAGAEECDSGGPSRECNLNCTIARCGDGLVSAGEECDSGSRENTDKCDWNCTVPTCGDTFVNQAAGEECDDGNKADDDDCLSTCKLSRCGDGHVNKPEESCDDRNTTTEQRCDYGAQSCENFCNGDCTARLKLRGSYCGDGVRDTEEVCDDGNSVTETGCPNGTWSCTGCNAACSKILDLSGPVCGNGVSEWGEACDDGNADSCGSCTADCKSTVSQTKAKGSIKVIQAIDLIDGETFTLNDGLHVPVVFEFNKAGGTASGHLAIDIDDSHTAENVAAIIRGVIAAIPKPTLAISTTVSNSTIKLENSQTGGKGNQSILKTVSHPGFAVTGMAGGKPYACSEGSGCVKPSDCAPGLTCLNNLCTDQ